MNIYFWNLNEWFFFTDVWMVCFLKASTLHNILMDQAKIFNSNVYSPWPRLPSYLFMYISIIIVICMIHWSTNTMHYYFFNVFLIKNSIKRFFIYSTNNFKCFIPSSSWLECAIYITYFVNKWITTDCLKYLVVHGTTSLDS